MIVEEINILSDEVHRRLKPLLNLETAIDLSSSHLSVPEDSSNRILPKSFLFLICNFTPYSI
ncbi:CLEC16A-like protein, partial [Trifolium medium]|nr:CLEC16A-like protein [Trifolium medium]